jgi:hypothetical protein
MMSNYLTTNIDLFSLEILFYEMSGDTKDYCAPGDRKHKVQLSSRDTIRRVSCLRLSCPAGYFMTPADPLPSHGLAKLYLHYTSVSFARFVTFAVFTTLGNNFIATGDSRPLGQLVS